MSRVGFPGVGGGDTSVLAVVALVVIGTLLGALGRDQWLSVQVRRRKQLMLAEFPTVAELLALSVGAGEGAAGALERVSRTCRGELSAELRRTLADARAGATLVQALEGLAGRTWSGSARGARCWSLRSGGQGVVGSNPAVPTVFVQVRAVLPEDREP